MLKLGGTTRIFYCVPFLRGAVFVFWEVKNMETDTNAQTEGQLNGQEPNQYNPTCLQKIVGQLIAKFAGVYCIGVIAAIAILEFGRFESQPNTEFLTTVRNTLANTFLAQGLVVLILPSIFYAVKTKLCSLSVTGYITESKELEPLFKRRAGLAGLSEAPKKLFSIKYNYYHNGRMFTRKAKINLDFEPTEGSTFTVRIIPSMPSVVYDGGTDLRAWIRYLVLGAFFVVLFFFVKYDLFNVLSDIIPYDPNDAYYE